MNALSDLSSKLFDSSYRPQRWDSGKWGGLHASIYIPAGLVAGAAFVVNPLIFKGDSAEKKNFSNSLFYSFTIFSLAVGITYLLEALSFWYPFYRFNTIVSLLTAVTSGTGFFRIVQFYPQVPSRVSNSTERQKTQEVSGDAMVRHFYFTPQLYKRRK